MFQLTFYLLHKFSQYLSEELSVRGCKSEDLEIVASWHILSSNSNTTYNIATRSTTGIFLIHWRVFYNVCTRVFKMPKLILLCSIYVVYWNEIQAVINNDIVGEKRERVKQVLSYSKGMIWEHLIITGILSYKCADYSQTLWRMMNQNQSNDPIIWQNSSCKHSSS